MLGLRHKKHKIYIADGIYQYEIIPKKLYCSCAAKLALCKHLTFYFSDVCGVTPDLLHYVKFKQMQ